MTAPVSIEGTIMTTAVLQAPFVLRRAREDDDPEWRMLMTRTAEIMQPLLMANNSKQLRRRVERSVSDYTPIRVLLGFKLVSAASEAKQSGEDLVAEINAEIWDALGSESKVPCLPADRKILMEVLRHQAEFAALAENVPFENKAALLAAFMDGYWALQKLDLCISTVLFIALMELRTQRDETVHWLCLAARHYLNEWQSALFANDPVLQERLSRPLESLKTISSEEMRNRLEL